MRVRGALGTASWGLQNPVICEPDHLNHDWKRWGPGAYAISEHDFASQ